MYFPDGLLRRASCSLEGPGLDEHASNKNAAVVRLSFGGYRWEGGVGAHKSGVGEFVSTKRPENKIRLSVLPYYLI